MWNQDRKYLFIYNKFILKENKGVKACSKYYFENIIIVKLGKEKCSYESGELLKMSLIEGYSISSHAVMF